MKINPFVLAVAVAFLPSVSSIQAGSAAPHAPNAASFGSWDSLEWKPSASLPNGFEYHLIQDDPSTGGIHALVRLARKAALGPHTHDCDETLILLKGKLRIRSGGDNKLLGPGDYAVIPAGVVHEVKSECWKGVVMILSTNGPYGVKPVK